MSEQLVAAPIKNLANIESIVCFCLNFNCLIVYFDEQAEISLAHMILGSVDRFDSLRSI